MVMHTFRPWRCISTTFSLLFTTDVTTVFAGNGGSVGVGSDVDIGLVGCSGSSIIRWYRKSSWDQQIAKFLFVGFQRSNYFVRECIVGNFPRLYVESIKCGFFRRDDAGDIFLCFQWLSRFFLWYNGMILSGESTLRHTKV